MVLQTRSILECCHTWPSGGLLEEVHAGPRRGRSGRKGKSSRSHCGRQEHGFPGPCPSLRPLGIRRRLTGGPRVHGKVPPPPRPRVAKATHEQGRRPADEAAGTRRGGRTEGTGPSQRLGLADAVPRAVSWEGTSLVTVPPNPAPDDDDRLRTSPNGRRALAQELAAPRFQLERKKKSETFPRKSEKGSQSLDGIGAVARSGTRIGAKPRCT